jgi:hypothetical protein
MSEPVEYPALERIIRRAMVPHISYSDGIRAAAQGVVEALLPRGPFFYDDNEGQYCISAVALHALRSRACSLLVSSPETQTSPPCSRWPHERKSYSYNCGYCNTHVPHGERRVLGERRGTNIPNRRSGYDRRDHLLRRRRDDGSQNQTRRTNGERRNSLCRRVSPSPEKV